MPAFPPPFPRSGMESPSQPQAQPSCPVRTESPFTPQPQAQPPCRTCKAPPPAGKAPIKARSPAPCGMESPPAGKAPSWGAASPPAESLGREVGGTGGGGQPFSRKVPSSPRFSSPPRMTHPVCTGFTAAAGTPASIRARRSAAVTVVFPASVSVPVMKSPLMTAPPEAPIPHTSRHRHRRRSPWWSGNCRSSRRWLRRRKPTTATGRTSWNARRR